MNQLWTRIFIFMVWMPSLSYAQSYPIRGEIRTPDGSGVPYASILVDQSNKGTSANELGNFILTVGTEKGQLHIRALGFQSLTIDYQWPKDSVLVIQLRPDVYTLPEIQIGTYEDPAYFKIRQAIKKRKTHLAQSQSYQATVYIKGTQRFINAPKSVFGLDLKDVYQEIGLDSNRRGIFYLSESESKIWSDPPSLFKEEMISSRMAGNPRGFSFNRASDLKVNLYENANEVLRGLGQRPFISPISDQALGYYTYKLVGESLQDGRTISKIEVIPRRKGDPVYQGFVYLIDDEWRLEGVHLFLTKMYGAQIVDTLSITQQFQPTYSGEWMMANSRIDFSAKLLGFEIEGEFAAVYSAFKPQSHLTKAAYKEAFKIPEGANQKDQDYWEDKRPVALTQEEWSSFLIKDSLSIRRDSPAYKDSLDRVQNKVSWSSVWSGYQHTNRIKRQSWSIGGLIESIGYNTVEGLSLSIPIQWQWQKDSVLNRPYIVALDSRYGIANQLFTSRFKGQAPLKNGYLRLSLGSDLRDLSSAKTLTPFVNTLYTLIDGHNYLKLYQHRSIEMSYESRLPGNLRYTLEAQWADRSALHNSHAYSFVPASERSFTSNNPLFPDLDTLLFPRNQAFEWSVQFAYNFSNKYQSLPWGKSYLPSKHPELRVKYKMGIPTFGGSEVDYQWIQLSLSQRERSLGQIGKVSYSLKAGQFLRNQSSFYTDWIHFGGRETLIDQVSGSQFLLLPYYTSFSKEKFAEGHIQYHLSTLLTSKIPFVRRYKIQEHLGISAYTTSDRGAYAEAHAGLSWGPIQVVYARRLYHDPLISPARQGLRIGLRF
jgi:hypothetical protein